MKETIPLAFTVHVDNASLRRDRNGEQVDAHDGALEYFDGRFYWYGTAYGTGDGFGTDHRFVVYSSTDLQDWEPHGDILTEYPTGHYYRPYVKRSVTGEYVL